MHSPFRSESDVFPAVVLVLLGTAAAVLVGALTEPWIGAVLAAGLIGVAIGFLVRASRGSLPERVAVAPGRGRHRILVLANQTVEGAELMAEVRNRAAGHEGVALLVVSPSLTRTRLELLASDVDGARAEAAERLRRSLATLRGAGFEATGETGDADPVEAAKDALREFGADEVVVSTLPPSSSRWLERRVVERLREELDLPVAHVVVGVGERSGVGGA